MIYINLDNTTSHVLGCRFDDGEIALNDPGESSRIERNRFESVGDAIVNPQGTGGIIRGNYVDANDHFILNDDSNMFGWIIEGNHVNQGDIEHNMGMGAPTSRQVVFANNYLTDGVYDLRRIIGLSFVGNTILGGPGGATHTMQVWECDSAVISDNLLLEVADDVALWVHDSQDVIVSSNAFIGTASGIDLHVEFDTTEWQYALVEGNVVGPGSGNVSNHLFVIECEAVVKGNMFNAAYHSGDDDTYDVIQVIADDCIVEGNKIITDTGGGLPRYGINIVSGSDNAVVGNYLGAAADYGTAPIGDSGTSTQLTYPGGTFGDNFTL